MTIASMKNAWRTTLMRFTLSCPTTCTANLLSVPQMPVFTSYVKNPWQSASSNAKR